FGLLETERGDFVLSPAYDLLNTKLHVDDPDFALNDGLFADNFKSRDWKKNGSPSQLDFTEFGKRIGIRENRIATLLQPFRDQQNDVKQLIDRSFLADSEKRGYFLYYNRKKNLLG
ncbi:MAG: type II toxin-antitoxin system HipA family toxin, partial [Pedobacter sp.]|nr:type II toxin-antitoxin system HipA family toxin [Pedobacter sp.]